MSKPLQVDHYDIAVVIPVRNRRLDLERCLAAIYAQDFRKERFELIVCDDGSNENLSEVIDRFKYRFANMRYIRQRAKGPATARNLGILHARSPIIAFTDSDTVPDQRWLSSLHPIFSHNTNIVGVEGKVIADDEAKFHILGEGPTNKVGGVYLTCNCAYRRDALIAAGGFDESFPYPAYEDTEIAARLLQIGEIVWQPEAIVIHPRRAITLTTVLKKLQHWEYALTMGFRYGFLAWRQYPVTYPKLRVIALAVIALPLAKIKIALNNLKLFPRLSLKLFLLGAAESLGALFYVMPKILFSSRSRKTARIDYLDQQLKIFE